VDIVTLEQLFTSHGLPMVITVVVIFFLFKYFMKQLDKPGNNCKDELKTSLDLINKSIEKNNKEIGECKQSLSNLKGLLSGIFFRNAGGNND
jgi:hypothetical protein